MTRIIAGAASSLTLATPKGSATRPTSERVREALLGSLEARGTIDGAAVLDLYAGSGALGLEALSRGARSVEMVDNSGQAFSVCSANATRVLKSMDLPAETAQAFRASVTAFLARTTSTYDLVFIDPPYPYTEDVVAADLEALVPHLADAAVVTVERSSRSDAPAWPDGFDVDEPRRYGETVIHAASWVKG